VTKWGRFCLSFFTPFLLSAPHPIRRQIGGREDPVRLRAEGGGGIASGVAGGIEERKGWLGRRSFRSHLDSVEIFANEHRTGRTNKQPWRRTDVGGGADELPKDSGACGQDNVKMRPVVVCIEVNVK